MPDGKDDDDDECNETAESGGGGKLSAFREEEEEEGAEAFFAITHVIHFAESLFLFFHCDLLKRSFGRSALQLAQVRVGGVAISFSVLAAAAAAAINSLSLWYRNLGAFFRDIVSAKFFLCVM